MANGIRTGDPHGFNKECSSKFHEGSWVWQTPEEGRRTYRPKRWGNNNKDEDNSPKTLNNKNSKMKYFHFYTFCWMHIIVIHFILDYFCSSILFFLLNCLAISSLICSIDCTILTVNQQKQRIFPIIDLSYHFHFLFD